MDLSSEYYNLIKLDSRKTVGYMLSKLHEVNDKIVVVYADVGSRFNVKGNLNNRELEIGISEQSLIPILGGMAHEGYIPYGIAYAPFITMRAADQIRMTVGQMALNIILIGGSAGLVSGNLGAASLALDDLSMMRAIPNMVIMSPSDTIMEAYMINEAAKLRKPVYIRLTGNKIPNIYRGDSLFEFGKAIEIYNSGKDAVIYTTGAITYNVIEAAKRLHEINIDVTVVDVPYIKPIDSLTVERYSKYPLAFTVEEHSVIGGLYSAISEIVAHEDYCKLVAIGINDTYLYPDSYDSLLKYVGLDVDSLTDRIKNNILENKKI